MAKEVILITSNFPSYPGEEFLETELKYWAQHKNVHLTIMPIAMNTKRRPLPENIALNFALINKTNKIAIRLFYITKSLISKMFYRELFTYVLKKPQRFKDTLISFVRYLYFKDKLKSFLKTHNTEELIFYTYWNTEVTYALQSLKENYGFKLVSRIHRFDLYQEEKNNQYMPLKRAFLSHIDKIYTITENAETYLIKTYGFDKSIIQTSRLGVDLHNIICTPNRDSYHILSCSYLTQVKQIDKLIEALAKLSNRISGINIKWTHIGSGELNEEIQKFAYQELHSLSNLSYHFLGNLSNKDVYTFYKGASVDVFVNVSASEGAPVSIMEALSCHIPIIAPDIGGISEMVINKYNGILLSKEFTIDEVVTALSATEFFKNNATRRHAFDVYLKKYNAEKNYTNFIQKVLELK